MGDLSYMEPYQLSSLLRSNEKNNVTVVDVRDDDFEGGHIKGAVNIPSLQFNNEPYMEPVVQNLQKSSLVVVHCMFSQVRGPKCARILNERLKRLFTSSAPEVCVLRGGFANFSALYSLEADLIEK
mmetsp:Transcript_29963/g.54821  ORF Transcript_29963/g.54821 Transcript_29963/m.54821 type:complete len:126 (-) Transcript_29963:155-532(-)